jgi:uroporphyrinogen-III decarboxylase
MTSKEKCLAAINGQPVDRTPVFPLLMFFAADQAKISYKEFAANGSAMAQVQLKMFETFAAFCDSTLLNN